MSFNVNYSKLPLKYRPEYRHGTVLPNDIKLIQKNITNSKGLQNMTIDENPSS